MKDDVAEEKRKINVLTSIITRGVEKNILKQKTNLEKQITLFSGQLSFFC